MKKTLLKKLFRDIKKTFSRFLSIVIIIAVGVAFYVGIRATSPDMKISGDSYLAQNNFMDFKLVSTLGLTKDDMDEVGKQTGVSRVEGSFSIDAAIEKDKNLLVLNINSLPHENGINIIRIVKGRTVESENEAVVEERFLKEYKLKIGDVIALKSGKVRKIEEDLKISKFTIVGSAQSPLYLSEQRQLSSVGNGTVRGFVYILPDVFKSDVFTEIYVKIDTDKSKLSLSDNKDYRTATESIEKNLKNLGIIRSKVRYEEVYRAAQNKINEAEYKLSSSKKDIKKPKWYVLGRSSNVGYETYRQDSDRIGNIGKSFPLIFFLVASLVSLTTMTRMVQENRIEIGTLKALGYSRTAIVSHYLIYSIAASLIGSILSIPFAFKLFPPLIINAYKSLYTIPETITPFNLKFVLQASLLAIFFTTIAAVAATLEELKEVPASLMRPKPPKSGKIVLLERATFLWKRLSFTKKVTARNIFRYKQRFFMTVIGIAACTGLIITGFGLKGGITGAAENQFNKIYKYDMQATLNKNMDTDDKNNTKSMIMEDANIKSVLFIYSRNGSVKDANTSNQDTYVVIPEDRHEFIKYINLTMNGSDLKLDENGIIITEKLSNLINKKAGDKIEITLDDKVVKAKVSAVTQHYLQHYIYMSHEYYQKVTAENLKFNGFYGLLKSTSDISKNRTSNTLAGIENIGSISFKSNLHIDFNNVMKSINSVVLILIISAGVLAFVVIYNLTNINITERKRELATIKLLGFYNKELAFYIYRENIILTLIGSMAGILFGKILNNFILNTAETNLIMFFKKIEPIYILYSVLLTLSFSIFVNLAMYRQFDKIDMIESLKSAE